MRVFRRPEELHVLPSEMRRLLERRLRQLGALDTWGECILVEPGEGIPGLDQQLGGWLVSESGAAVRHDEGLTHPPGPSREEQGLYEDRATSRRAANSQTGACTRAPAGGSDSSIVYA